MNRLTQLQAVNIVLRAARELPVSDLDEQTLNEVLLAVQILDEWDLTVQSPGLYTNTFEEEFTPDETTGEINLSPNTIFVTAWGQSLRRELTFQEDSNVLKLYDIERPEDPFDFSDDTTLCLRYFLRVDFEDGLTHAQQRWIVDEAAREYQMATVGSTSMDAILQQKAARSRAMARRENMMATRANAFNNSRSNLARSQARVAPRAWLPESDGQRQYRRSGG